MNEHIKKTCSLSWFYLQKGNTGLSWPKIIRITGFRSTEGPLIALYYLLDCVWGSCRGKANAIACAVHYLDQSIVQPITLFTFTVVFHSDKKHI